MSRLCGAGVIPFCQYKGKVLFLLAKECHVPNWRGSSRWSGFEGGVRGDEDAEQNAVREFCEESMCILNADVRALEHVMYAKDYAMRVNVITEPRDASCTEPTLHSTFVKEFEYDADLPRKFEKRREELIAIKKASEALDTCTKTLPDSCYPFFKEAHPILCMRELFQVYKILDVLLKDAVFTVCVALRNEHGDEKTRTFCTHVCASTEEPARAYKAWFDARCHCETLLAQARAPAACTSVIRNANGTVHTIKVLSEFLEKSCIRYWEFDELSQCLKGRSHTSEIFRPYFLMVIRTVLKCFETS